MVENYLDLFSGIGGFRLGLEQAGFKFNWEGHSEIDKYAEEIYHRHFPQSECLGDVRTVDPYRLPRIDLITFGFPCQDLSLAGRRKGLHGERSGLFFEAMRIIRAVKPKVFIFENVKGLLSSNGGRDFVRVLREIADIGLYECEWQVVNTRWFLPQNRERIYFVGHLGGKSRPKVFPIGAYDGMFNETFKEARGEKQRVYSPCINAGYGKTRGGELFIKDSRGGMMMPQIYQLPRGYNQGGLKDVAGSITTSAFEHNNFVVSKSCKQTLKKVGVIKKDTQGQRVYSPEGIACNISANGGGQGAKTGLYLMKNSNKTNIRRLTPLECERLQGFPDGWTEGLSDTQRYKCLGNAVSVPVAKEIGKRLIGGV